VTDRLLTAREVAERLGFSPETVLRWTRAGDLPALRLGRSLRYRPADVDAWLELRSTADPGGSDVAETLRPRTGPAAAETIPLGRATSRRQG
jgi:excisionase family DNA binding protein